MGLNTPDLLSQLVKEVLHNSCNVDLPYIAMYVSPKARGPIYVYNYIYVYISTLQIMCFVGC